MSVGRVPVLGWVAHAVSVLTAIILALMPCSYRSVSTTSISSVGSGGAAEPITTTTCSSLIEASGSGVWVALFIPAVFTLIAVLGFVLRLRAMFLAPTILLGVGCILTGFSIGMFFMPTALLLAIACATWRDLRPEPAG